MIFGSHSEKGGVLLKIRSAFQNREFFVHDGKSMRRFRVSARQQYVAAGVAVCVTLVAFLSLGQLAASFAGFSNSISQFAAHESALFAMERKVAALREEVSAAKQAARTHVARLEARQSVLAAMLKGQSADGKLAAMIPARAEQASGASSDIAAVFSQLDREQLAMAGVMKRAADARIAEADRLMTRLGVSHAQSGGMGGPYEPVPAAATSVTSDPGSVAPTPRADPQFRALFESWRRLDQAQTTLIAIPSQRPVDMAVSINSGFGVRSDPFNGGRAMHAGVDIPGPYATRIYATADAIVGRTGWVGGYGNLIELEHGKGIQTRYGHLSQILVAPGTRVHRGQLIGLMGSTGRSTGNHLHYEVRLDGHAVNPIPFLQTADYLQAMQRRTAPQTAVGGPVEGAGQPTAGK